MTVEDWKLEVGKQLFEAFPGAIRTLKEIIEDKNTPPHVIVRAANSLTRAERQYRKMIENHEANKED